MNEAYRSIQVENFPLFDLFLDIPVRNRPLASVPRISWKSQNFNQLLSKKMCIYFLSCESDCLTVINT